MIKRNFLILGLILLLGAWISFPLLAWNAAANEGFQKANQRYSQQEYREASELYENLAQEFSRAGVLYFNLGNAYYRLGEIGRSILNYERAMIRIPRNRDVRDNLKYVASLLEYRVEDKRNWYIRAGDHFLRYFRDDEILLMALLSYFLFISGCTFAVFYKRGMPWGWRRKLLLSITLICFTLVGAKKIQMDVVRDAIIMKKEAEVRFGPSASDQVAFRLPEGFKAHVVDRREKWSRIILKNNESGWIRNDQIEEVML